MPNKCDSNIYGADDTGMATRIAGESLDTSKGSEDIWGATSDESARAKGNRPLDQDNNFRKRSVKTDGDKPGNSEGN